MELLILIFHQDQTTAALIVVYKFKVIQNIFSTRSRVVRTHTQCVVDILLLSV